MVCVGFSGDICNGSVPVYLNVYDLNSLNGYAHWVGVGVYHSGVEVHGIEYAFGAHQYPTTGIFEGEPQKCEGFKFRTRILIGKTEMDGGEVRKAMEVFAQVYRGNAYDLITRNCNHFCNDACRRLTGNPIPGWINRLARIGFLFKCFLPPTWNSIEVRNLVKVGEKARGEEEEEEKKTLASRSPSCTDHRRGRTRTRTRRAPAPASP